MLTHVLERGVLVLTVQDGLGSAEPNILARLISDLVHVHAPTPVVVVLGTTATTAVIAAVVRAYRLCSELDVLLSVAVPSAPARRTLRDQAAADGAGLVVHARTDVAIATAYAAAA
ncbi:hypothetical protein [Streptomyces sp. NPDC048643]|uniref:hypothetical protein n=1 Tax=Streptomyces sp. NPDC048643 TaxID=3155637 RepID=UPI003414CE6E